VLHLTPKTIIDAARTLDVPDDVEQEVH